MERTKFNTSRTESQRTSIASQRRIVLSYLISLLVMSHRLLLLTQALGLSGLSTWLQTTAQPVAVKAHSHSGTLNSLSAMHTTMLMAVNSHPQHNLNLTQDQNQNGTTTAGTVGRKDTRQQIALAALLNKVHSHQQAIVLLRHPKSSLPMSSVRSSPSSPGERSIKSAYATKLSS